jgi:DNA-binding phage protein
MALELTDFDVAEHLDAKGLDALLADALSSGDRKYIDHAEGIVARAREGEVATLTRSG